MVDLDTLRSREVLACLTWRYMTGKEYDPIQATSLASLTKTVGSSCLPISCHTSSLNYNTKFINVLLLDPWFTLIAENLFRFEQARLSNKAILYYANVIYKYLPEEKIIAGSENILRRSKLC